MIVGMTVTQLLLKQAALSIPDSQDPSILLLTNKWLWLALFSACIALMAWMFALRQLSLSAAYPWTALIYALTPISSSIIFHEELTYRYLAGVLLILAGSYLSIKGMIETR